MKEPFVTETIDKLFLELSQVTNAVTQKEMVLEQQREALLRAAELLLDQFEPCKHELIFSKRNVINQLRTAVDNVNCAIGVEE